MRLATWNVNSARARQFRLIDWLDRTRPDVVCLQETKVADGEFAELYADDLFRRDYEFAHYGSGRWNGVAILSRIGLADVVRGLDAGVASPTLAARAVSARCSDVRVWSVYVPNGRSPDDPQFELKLRWLAALRRTLAESSPSDRGGLVVCGDFNIAPADRDVWDPAVFVGSTHVTPAERSALADLQALGLVDVVRRRWPTETVFTYWDYRAGMFHQDHGMRIDLVLASEAVSARIRAAWVDRQARKGREPSDHAPVIVDLDVAPDGDIGPVVPPPSAAR